MELFRLIDDEAYVISDFRICSEEVMEVVTTMAKEENEHSFKTNVFIAAFTTTHVRLKL